MSAKELKAIADVGITLGYSGDESYVADVLGHTENWSKHMEILPDFLKG